MLGRAGGGFVFDTNALHKGEVRGTAERTTVILEFHRWGKVRPLEGAGAPCPSAERGPRQRAFGVGGWPLYPPERASPERASPRTPSPRPPSSFSRLPRVLPGTDATRLPRTPRTLAPRT